MQKKCKKSKIGKLFNRSEKGKRIETAQVKESVQIEYRYDCW
jgi:hypothetical protein